MKHAKHGWKRCLATFPDVNVAYTKDGAAFDGVPTEAGSYTASVTVGGATATVAYTIVADPTVRFSGAGETEDCHLPTFFRLVLLPEPADLHP